MTALLEYFVNFKAAYYHIIIKDPDTLVEQSPVTSIPIEQTPLCLIVLLK